MSAKWFYTRRVMSKHVTS